jgi:hypothetical protein
MQQQPGRDVRLFYYRSLRSGLGFIFCFYAHLGTNELAQSVEKLEV